MKLRMSEPVDVLRKSRVFAVVGATRNRAKYGLRT
jgi:predicted CoA-binding protein